jgi:hypothetical protein
MTLLNLKIRSWPRLQSASKPISRSTIAICVLESAGPRANSSPTLPLPVERIQLAHTRAASHIGSTIFYSIIAKQCHYSGLGRHVSCS